MLKTLWKAIKLLGRGVGHVQTWGFLTLVYVIGVAPVALIYRFVADPLRLRRSSSSFWRPRSQTTNSMPWAKSQF